MQQIATLLGATCCTRLATLLQCVVACCKLKIELVHMPTCNTVAWTWPNDYNILQHPQMLHEKFYHFQIRANNTKHVATHCNRVAKCTLHVAPYNIEICCIEMLQSFDQNFGCIGRHTNSLYLSKLLLANVANWYQLWEFDDIPDIHMQIIH